MNIIFEVIRKELVEYREVLFDNLSRYNRMIFEDSGNQSKWENKKQKVEAKLRHINTLFLKIGNVSFQEGVRKSLRKRYKNDRIIFDNVDNIFNFRNGVYEIYTDTLRERRPEDYLTKFLDFDFKRATPERIEWYENRITEVDEENSEELLHWVGYYSTSRMEKENMLILIGESASNGKTSIFNICKECFPIYCKALNEKTFNISYEKCHKQFVELKPPMRMVFMNELRTKELDINRLKDFCNGVIGGVEIMYGTRILTSLIVRQNGCLKFYITFSDHEIL